MVYFDNARVPTYSYQNSCVRRTCVFACVHIRTMNGVYCTLYTIRRTVYIVHADIRTSVREWMFTGARVRAYMHSAYVTSFAIVVYDFELN